MTTGCPHNSDSFCPNVRARMSVALPAVNGTMIFTGFVGHACALANELHSAQSAIRAMRPILMTSSWKISTEAVADGDVLGHQFHACGLGFEHQQLGEVVLGHPAADQRLNDVACDRGERHRNAVSPCGVESEIDVLAQ